MKPEQACEQVNVATWGRGIPQGGGAGQGKHGGDAPWRILVHVLPLRSPRDGAVGGQEAQLDARTEVALDELVHERVGKDVLEAQVGVAQRRRHQEIALDAVIVLRRVRDTLLDGLRSRQH